MKKVNHLASKIAQRKRRIRAKIFGTAKRPRLNVYRSNRYIYLQAIDDQSGKVLASIHDKNVRGGDDKKKAEVVTKTESAVKAAQELAKKLKTKKITEVVFDRGPYRYHGRVKAVAETLREQKINL